MPSRDIDTRYVSFVDIPLLRRLSDKYIVLDNEHSLTHESNELAGGILSSVLLPQRSIHTLITRYDTQQVVAQFRIRPDEPNAHILCIAPDIEPHVEDTAWLHLFDAMAREAGKVGAHALLAEVDEHGILFETMRTAGYAVYARQEIWRREPGNYPSYEDIDIREESENDTAGVHALIANTVPGLVQQYAMPPSDMPRLVYRSGDRIDGYFAYAEGKNGIYLMPYLHPDTMSNAPDIIQAVIAQIPRHNRVPVYVCVRRYQDWIMEALDELAFEPCAQQAVMVKHIAAGVRHPRFDTLKAELKAARNSVKPPTLPMVQWDEIETL